MSASLASNASIFVTGHRGLAGAAIVRCLQRHGFSNILTATRQELDLRDQTAVSNWFAGHKPDCVLHVAGTVGRHVREAEIP